jgi:hypothetical protein
VLPAGADVPARLSNARPARAWREGQVIMDQEGIFWFNWVSTVDKNQQLP